MRTIQDILDRLKKFEEIDSDYAVAKVFGTNQSTVSSWRKRNTIPYEQLTDYCERKGLNLMWLLTGEGHPEIPGSSGPPSDMGQLIPVVGLAEAGPGIFGGDRGFPAGTSDEYISPPQRIRDPNAFFVCVEGESMLPVYRPRQRILVSPSLECQSGDRAVVKLSDDRKLIAEVHFRDDHVLLKKYNNEDIVVPRKDLVFCYKIVWVKEL